MSDPVGDAPEVSDKRETDASLYTGPLDALDESQHTTKHAQQVHSMHKPVRSPLEANLQPLIPSPIYGQVPKPSERQQHQKQQLPGGLKQLGQQQGRQAVQQPWQQEERTQKGMLPIQQLHNGTASSILMTGRKVPANLTADADLMGGWAAPGMSIHSNASCRDSNRAADLQQVCLIEDKENTQAPGRKGPVRKALFGGQGDVFSGSQALASAWPSEPASDDGAAGGLHAVKQYTDVGSAGTQQPAESAPPSRGHDTVDFASVFDFL